MLQLVALFILTAENTFQGLEGNPALGRKGGAEVGSICSSLFTYKYQVRNWKFINKWIPSLPMQTYLLARLFLILAGTISIVPALETAKQAKALVEMKPLENAP
jgi:hypothetical protein